MSIEHTKNLPWWTWAAPLAILYLCDLLSQCFIIPSGSMLFYLPIPVGIFLVHVWGPRVLLSVFLNSILVSTIWELEAINWTKLILSHETACVAMSWVLFSYWKKGEIWMPNIFSLLQFIALGILIPITVNSLFLFIFSDSESVWLHLAMVWTADFASTLAIVLPALYLIVPGMEHFGISLSKGSEYVKPLSGLRLLRSQRLEVAASLAILIILCIIVPIDRFWFVHGLCSIYIGVRFGFGLSLLAVLGVFTLTYLVPFLGSESGNLAWAFKSDLVNIHFGMSLLSMTACITGRVISDLRQAERKLSQQLRELEKTNYELDRFVYSASHDLSAPIKSILGLITISRLDTDPHRMTDYINKIETCSIKLENFLQEILDYSRNNHLENKTETIDLRGLLSELFADFKNEEMIQGIQVTIDGDISQIETDRSRLKIVLKNLISNAIKYQRNSEGHERSITIKSESSNGYILIHITDNGQGIRAEHIDKIFSMFFRGSLESNGSGLGLYLAKEAVKKLGGKITVQSAYGNGSTFTAHIPNSSNL